MKNCASSPANISSGNALITRLQATGLVHEAYLGSSIEDHDVAEPRSFPRRRRPGDAAHSG